MKKQSNKTTLEVSKDTRNRLAAICGHDETFDGKINELITGAQNKK